MSFVSAVCLLASAVALTATSPLAAAAEKRPPVASGMWVMERNDAPTNSCRVALTPSPNDGSQARRIEFEPGPVECFSGLGTIEFWFPAQNGTVALLDGNGTVRVTLVPQGPALIDAGAGVRLVRPATGAPTY